MINLVPYFETRRRRLLAREPLADRWLLVTQQDFYAVWSYFFDCGKIGFPDIGDVKIAGMYLFPVRSIDTDFHTTVWCVEGNAENG